ncbi:hypothetical protein CTA2_5451 [Colletotrichum tanaceti]|uniref:Zn(2)-C6 fungal-type domain-containing protein n=1 Tax=Colletotrichum tanaceti TaxID=1306861 RepID=A0A4U6X774_9PEZI|nr:hypothetical protein CTA2_5451 [Colletotrichum tanaceti]TKW51318.1 hypothetical protein CTA1_13002 [Colletotrichum tanaceti]
MPVISSLATKPRRTLAGPIFRVRTGCLTCRGRKKKCDETKPRCRGCERNKLDCRWPSSTTGSSGDGAPRSARESSVSLSAASRGLARHHAGGGGGGASTASPASSTTTTTTTTGASHIVSPQAAQDSSFALEAFDFASQPTNTSSESPAAATIGSNSPGSNDAQLFSAATPVTPVLNAVTTTTTTTTTTAHPHHHPHSHHHPHHQHHHIDDADIAYHFDASDHSPIAGLLPDGSPPHHLPFTTIEGNDGDGDDDETVVPMASSSSSSSSSSSPLLRRVSDASSFLAPPPPPPRAMSLLGGSHDDDSLELLSHYLSATTISMANGSTTENPFSVQLIPLAFGSDLVLHLLLTQSAVHRAAKSLAPTTDRVAAKYYNQSLRLFQQNISTFMGRQHGEESLILGIGALILCLVETAKGDVNGTILDHLMAAQSLILPFLSAANTFLHKTLKDFLTEYYLYTAAVSMISIDARLSDQLFLSNDLLLLATELVASSYIGSLCGCWLDLILLIPSVFDLGRRMMGHDGDDDDDEGEGEGNPVIGTVGTVGQRHQHRHQHRQQHRQQHRRRRRRRQPSADDFILFAQLLSQIQNWQPNPTVSGDVALAGYIYQKALLLYLHTALHPLSRDESNNHSMNHNNTDNSTNSNNSSSNSSSNSNTNTNTNNNTTNNNSMHSAAVQAAVGGALSHLAQLDPSVRINTSLCWPMTIIGSCVTDRGQQAFLHERLGHMFATIGLGNIRQTSVLLQHVWDHNEAVPADVGAGPWNVCRVMNEKQIWISFA